MSPAGLPPWLLAGATLGALLAALVAAAFLAGERLVPESRPEDGRDDRRRSGEGMRREQIADYLDALGERYDTDATVEGHEVAFYLPERDVAVTFDPRTYFSLDDTGVHAILFEQEMHATSLGDRLPFETPSVGADRATGDRGSAGTRRRTAGGQAGERQRVRTAFETLGLRPGASLEDVEAAYRERVKEVHPDHGGDERSFKRIREAYDTAREHAD